MSAEGVWGSTVRAWERRINSNQAHGKQESAKQRGALPGSVMSSSFRTYRRRSGPASIEWIFKCEQY